MSTVVETREVVERDICPQCGHTAGWHGENHDDGCNATGDCHCGLNARDCYASINKSAAIDALIAAVRAEERARCVGIVEGLTRYRGIKQSIQRNGDMVRWTWPADEEKHRYCANVLDRNEVLAALTGGPHE